MIPFEYITIIQQIAMVLAFCGAISVLGFEPARNVFVKFTIAPIVYVVYVWSVGLSAYAEKERMRTSMIVTGGISAA